MELHQNTSETNNKTAYLNQLLEIECCLTIPNWLYHKKFCDGAANLVAITILSDLLLLYRRTNTNRFDYGYGYFERKFTFCRRGQLEEATIALEKAGLIERTFKTIIADNFNVPNELHIVLNLDALVALKKEIKTKLIDLNQKAESAKNRSHNRKPSLMSIIKRYI